MKPSPDAYLAACKRRFGTANPERMREPVWEWMVREHHNPYSARSELGLEPNYDTCGLPNNPDWCFQRMGAGCLEMTDGRRLWIAGEYEDWYDPDFCIYNDVVVRRGDEVSIFGYPRDIFPPTDFHTATLVGRTIWLIGSLGYPEDRGSETQVFRLDSETYHIERALAVGPSPGWLNRHVATLLEDGVTIEVSKGEAMRRDGDRVRWRSSTDVFRLDTRDLRWTKMTDTSSWRQYRIAYEQDISDFCMGRDLGWSTGEILQELGYRVDVAPLQEEECAEDQPHTLWIGEIPVRIEDSFRELRVTVEGVLTESGRRALLDQLRSLLESTRRRVGEITEC